MRDRRGRGRGIVGRRIPRALAARAKPGSAQFAARVAGGLDERGREGAGIALRHDDARAADDVGQRAGVARDDGNAAGHRLDRDAAELLGPARGRDRGHREHVDRAVEAGHASGATGRRLDAVGDAERGARGPAVIGERSGAGDPQRAARVGAGSQEDDDPLFGHQAPEKPTVMTRPGRRSRALQ